MKGNEFKILKAIEEKRAKARQIRKPIDSVPEKLPEQKKGDARDIAAARVGWSGLSNFAPSSKSFISTF